MSTEAWITSVEDDGSVADALVLAYSLRLTYTNRNILALVSPSLSISSRVSLNEAFDGIFDISMEGRHFPDFSTFSKSYCWSLSFIQKCIFLDANTIVLENIDNLFLLNGIFVGPTIKHGEINTSIIGLTPALDIFSDILYDLKNICTASGHFVILCNEGRDGGTYFRNCDYESKGAFFGKYLAEKHNLHFLDPAYNFGFVMDAGRTVGTVKRPKILNLADYTKMANDVGRVDIQKEIAKLKTRLYNQIFEQNSSTIASTNFRRLSFSKEPIAIIGMSCRFPMCNNIDEFWNLILNKKDAIQSVPEDRWTVEQSCFTRPETREIKAGFLKCPIDECDGQFFRISPMELSYTDPQQRLLLEISWEALEDAGINPLSVYGTRMGVFSGIWTNDYKDLMSESGFRGTEFYRTYMGNAFGTASGRISHFLGLTGPNIATESGCSSSMVAVGMACRSLRDNDSNLALACGVNLILRPFHYNDFRVVNSPDGHCKTFDANADGYGRAEGCAALILKRVTDALRDNNRIYALIKGYGEAQEGVSKSMGTPTVDCEATAMKLALEDAQAKPGDIRFVEAHGTGTPVGDPLEFLAITKVYSEGRTDELVVGSVKTNIGHTESCAGIAGIIKTVLCLEKEFITPHANFSVLNPKIDIAAIPALIPLEPISWKREDNKPRLAGVSSFGMTGTDSHLILEESPQIKTKIRSFSYPAMPKNILTLSASCSTALDELIRLYEKSLRANPIDLVDLCYTANCGRAHLSHRAVLIGTDCRDIVTSFESGQMEKQVVLEENRKICFLYTGQGSQYNGMGSTLYTLSPLFKYNFDECDKISESMLQISLQDVLWGKHPEKLDDTLYCQTYIFVIEYCLMKLWESWGIKPHCVLGHSLGEFAAATAAGILSLSDALKLVGTRGKLISRLDGGRMLVVAAGKQSVQKLVESFQIQNPTKWLDYAAFNSPGQTTIGGTEKTISEFSKFCSNSGIRTIMLSSTHAFHSREMDAMLSEYRKVAGTINYSKNFNCKFISGMDGNEQIELNAEYWVRHTREPVNFQMACQTLSESGYEVFIEIGPHPVLSALLKINYSATTTVTSQGIFCGPSMQKNVNEWDRLLKTVANLYLTGATINWKNFYKYQDAKTVSLPLYPFQRQRFWFDFENCISNRFQLELDMHPILGALIQTASDEQIFKSFVSLEKLPFINDHKIEDYILFPGACFLEVSMAAGYVLEGQFDQFISSSGGTSTAVGSLKIHSPFELKEGKMYELQTVVNITAKKSDKFSANISVYSRQHVVKSSVKDKWVRHSTVEYVNDLLNYPNSAHLKVKDLAQLKLNLANFPIGDFYPALAKLGYNFGPKFSSLRRMWRTDSEFLAEVVVPQEDPQVYLYHPIVTDAMIQSLLAACFSNIDAIYLPVGLKNVVWLRKNETKINYIYVYGEGSTSKKTAVLFDELGNTLATLGGFEVVKTNLENIKKSLGNLKSTLPPMFCEQWRKNGILETNENSEKSLSLKVQGELREAVDSFIPCAAESEAKCQLDKTIGYGIMKSLTELGWSPQSIGERVSIQSVMDMLKITSQSLFMIRRAFHMLLEDGFFISTGVDSFQTKTLFPSLNTLTAHFEKLPKCPPEKLRKEWESSILFLERFSEIITGKVDALFLLFPESTTGVNQITAETFYTDTDFAIQSNELLERCTDYITKLRVKGPNRKSALRILEVGGGTGSATKLVLNILKRNKINFSYTFTDISAAFFSKAAVRFQEFGDSMQYMVFNLEEDPKLQGFSPYTYDIVVASNVLHATRNLSECCRNIRHVLKNNGMLLILETFIPQRFLDLAFGHLDGYWRYNDYELRPDHCIISKKKWEIVLQSVGFNTALSFEVYGGGVGVIVAEASSSQPQYISPILADGRIPRTKIWILFSIHTTLSECITKQLRLADRMVFNVKDKSQPCSNKDQKNIKEISIEVNSKEDMDFVFETIKMDHKLEDIEGLIVLWGTQPTQITPFLTENYLRLLKLIISLQERVQPKVVLVTKGLYYIGDQEPTFPAASTLLGITRTFMSENSEVDCKILDLDPNYNSNCTTVADIVISELWKPTTEPIVAFREGERFVPRLTDLPESLSFPALELPNCERFALHLPNSKVIADLKFVMVPIQEANKDEVEVLVKAGGLNFKEIFNVLKPTSDFKDTNFLAADFAGIVIGVGSEVQRFKIGDAVFGCNHRHGAAALPSHITLPENEITAMPNQLTFMEGAIFPGVFATAYYCLKTLGKLKKGEAILIHAASGGVGLVAIQLANEIGATVYATAGSRRKRAYLKKLGVKHVFNSRSLNYGEKIMSETNSKGVDVVLNSLTGPNFKETSLNCSGKNARFIEMSKLNIWTIEEVNKLRPDVVYSIVDLGEVGPDGWRILMDNLNEYLSTNRLQPLPTTRFNAVNIRDALLYLQNAKQIGKVICIMPEIIKTEDLKIQINFKLFNERSTYLITGGLKGIGLEVASWMAERGAKFIVLCSRNPVTESSLERIKSIEDTGCKCVIQRADVGNYEQCKTLLEAIEHSNSNLPPLRGVMHCAGCLSDGLIVNQTWEKFQLTLNPKVMGTINLHLLTKNYNLEHFVLFSSFVSLIGGKGQSNHSAGNSFLDSVAHYRRAIGLTALSINWGQWGEAGIVAGKVIKGVRPMSNLEALKGLESAMTLNLTQVGIGSLNIGDIKSEYKWLENYFEELKVEQNDISKVTGDNKKLKLSTGTFWKELDKLQSHDERYNFVEIQVKQIILSIMQLKDDSYKSSKSFQNLGLDSLMTIELRNHIQTVLGNRKLLSVNALNDCNTLQSVTAKVVEVIFYTTEKDMADKREERKKLIHKDSIMWPNIKPVGVPPLCSEIKKVLLTGATGNLAPYVLKTLTNQEFITTVYCLVRSNNKQTSEERLKARLMKLKLLSSIKMSKVIVVDGNIAVERLGLAPELHSKLASEIDGVVNCAVYASHLKEYVNSEDKICELRDVNVIGAQRILEFATFKKTKWVYHASTLLAVLKGGEDGYIAEDWPEQHEFDNGPNFGYASSKFVADRIMAEAVRKGVPCKVFRFAMICGNSIDGRQDVEENHFFMRLLFYIKSGIVPDIPVPLIPVPVDICAEISIKLFFNDCALPGIFNVTNPHTMDERDVIHVAKEFGFSVKRGTYEEFIRQITNGGTKSLLFDFIEFYTDSERWQKVLEEMTFLKYWQKNPKDFFTSRKTEQIIPELRKLIENPLDILRRDIKFTIENTKIF